MVTSTVEVDVVSESDSVAACLQLAVDFLREHSCGADVVFIGWRVCEGGIRPRVYFRNLAHMRQYLHGAQATVTRDGSFETWEVFFDGIVFSASELLSEREPQLARLETL